MRKIVFSLLIALLSFVRQSAAAPIVIDFEGLPDSTILGTQYFHTTFSNAIVLTAGISLNEFDFPPHSGSNVAGDNGGPIRIDFDTPVSDVSGYFTYAEPLTLQAFGAGATLLGSAPSPFSENFASSAHPDPNELLKLPFSGISYVTFTGDALGSSFTLDDLTFTLGSSPPPPPPPPPPPTTAVPEPGSLSLVTIGCIVRRIRRRTREATPVRTTRL